MDENLTGGNKINPTKQEDPITSKKNKMDNNKEDGSTTTDEQTNKGSSKRKRKQSITEENSNTNEETEKGNKQSKEKVEISQDPTKRTRKRKRKKKNQSSNETPASESSNHPSSMNDLVQILSPDNNSSATQIRDAMTKLSNREVFVTGLPFHCTEDEVKEFFANGGCDDIIQMRLPRWQDSGRLRGYGHVVFSTTSSRDKAIQTLSGQDLKKRSITIVPSKQPRSSSMHENRQTNIIQPKNCCTIFVKNLPYDISESELEETFREFGDIDSGGGVRLALNSVTRKPKGFGYVQFQQPEAALAAVQQANSVDNGGGIAIRGRILYLDFEERGMKMSFRTREGKLWNKVHK